MSVDTTIPDSSNNVGDDLSAIRENFELLESAQVVDEGSTDDGDYIRYENGWQVCIKKTTLDLTTTDSQYRDMPQGFVDNDSYITSIDASAALGSINDREVAGSAVSYYDGDTEMWRCRCNGEGDKTDASITLLAIGRWK